MIITSEKQLKKAVEEILLDIVSDFILELDPEKYYILVLPEDMSVEQSSRVLKRFTDRANLAVLHAKDVKILELS